MHNKRNSRARVSIVRAALVVTIGLLAACDPRRVLEPDAGLQAQQGDEPIEMCIEGEADITADAFMFSTNFGGVFTGEDANAVQTLYGELEGLYGADREAPASNFGTVEAGTKELVTLQKGYTTVRIQSAHLVNGHLVEYDYSYRESGYWVLVGREVVEECPGDDPQGVLG